MQLDHLKLTHCPTCGSPVISERKEQKHTNGHWNESQTFECGMSLKWSPCYMSLDDRGCRSCPKTPEEIAKKDKRKEAKQKIINYIKKLKVDDVFKEDAISRVSTGIWYV